jgi:hypothetical protein
MPMYCDLTNGSRSTDDANTFAKDCEESIEKIEAFFKHKFGGDSLGRLGIIFARAVDCTCK